MIDLNWPKLEINYFRILTHCALSVTILVNHDNPYILSISINHMRSNHIHSFHIIFQEWLMILQLSLKRYYHMSFGLKAENSSLQECLAYSSAAINATHYRNECLHSKDHFKRSAVPKWNLSCNFCTHIFQGQQVFVCKFCHIEKGSK